MSDRSKHKNKERKERIWGEFDYMVCCISLGLRFKYYRNRRNKTIVIELAKNKTLYVDFDLWSSSMQRAFVYREDVQLPVGLSSVKDLVIHEGQRKDVTVCRALKKWIHILYTNDISFECCGDHVKITTEKCKEFEMQISFDANGVREAKYSLGIETYRFYFGQSLESVVFQTLDAIEKQESKMA